MNMHMIDIENLRRMRQREVQMIGAAISKSDMREVEVAYNQLRDKMDALLNAPMGATFPAAALDTRFRP